MGPKQIAGVMSTSSPAAAAGRGVEFDEEALAAQTGALEAQRRRVDGAVATGRVRDDGIIDPRDTRTVLGDGALRRPQQRGRGHRRATGSAGTDDPPPARRQPGRDRACGSRRTARAMGIAMRRGVRRPRSQRAARRLRRPSPSPRRVEPGRVVPRVAMRCCRPRSTPAADAIHPGYGFLSENAAFARVRDRRRADLGRADPEQIALLGDKLAAKKAAIEAGRADDADLRRPRRERCRAAHDPLLVKAAAGGGGKGMRIVRRRRRARRGGRGGRPRRRQSAFGDDTVFLERYVERGHHVEIQILGDRHGNVVHLGERECSIQRRHQKIIEESPSPASPTRPAAALWAAPLAPRPRTSATRPPARSSSSSTTTARSSSSRSTPACRSSTP